MNWWRQKTIMTWKVTSREFYDHIRFGTGSALKMCSPWYPHSLCNIHLQIMALLHSLFYKMCLTTRSHKQYSVFKAMYISQVLTWSIFAIPDQKARAVENTIARIDFLGSKRTNPSILLRDGLLAPSCPCLRTDSGIFLADLGCQSSRHRKAPKAFPFLATTYKSLELHVAFLLPSRCPLPRHSLQAGREIFHQAIPLGVRSKPGTALLCPCNPAFLGTQCQGFVPAEIPRHLPCLAEQRKGQRSPWATHKLPLLSSATMAARAGLRDPQPYFRRAIQETSLMGWELLISPQLGWIYPKVSGLVFRELDV